MQTPNLDLVLKKQVGGKHYQEKRSTEPARNFGNQNGYQACASKYIDRDGAKGHFIQDLEKAIHYIEMQIAWKKDTLLNFLERQNQSGIFNDICAILKKPHNDLTVEEKDDIDKSIYNMSNCYRGFDKSDKASDRTVIVEHYAE